MHRSPGISSQGSQRWAWLLLSATDAVLVLFQAFLSSRDMHVYGEGRRVYQQQMNLFQY